MCPFIFSAHFLWAFHNKSTQYCPSTFSSSVYKTFFSSKLLFLPVCLIFSLPQMDQLGKCNWNGRNVLPSSAAFSSCCVSTLLPCFLLHLHSFNLYFSVSSPFTPMSVTALISHHPILWSLCLLSFFSPPIRLASSQRDGNPSDLPDRCERQCAGADTSRGSGVWACSAQLQGQHHGLWRWRRPQCRALCLRAVFFSCQRSPQLDYFQT